MKSTQGELRTGAYTENLYSNGGFVTTINSDGYLPVTSSIVLSDIGKISGLTHHGLTFTPKEINKLDPKNIEKIIFNDPATIIIYKDGSKIVSKASGEDFDPEKGVMACFMKIIFESRGEFIRILDKAVEDSGLNKKEEIING